MKKLELKIGEKDHRFVDKALLRNDDRTMTAVIMQIVCRYVNVVNISKYGNPNYIINA